MIGLNCAPYTEQAFIKNDIFRDSKTNNSCHQHTETHIVCLFFYIGVIVKKENVNSSLWFLSESKACDITVSYPTIHKQKQTNNCMFVLWLQVFDL